MGSTKLEEELEKQEEQQEEELCSRNLVSSLTLRAHSPLLSTMDDDDDTTYVNNSNNNINGPDHHNLSSPPNSSISYNYNPSSTSSAVTPGTTTTSFDRPNMEDQVWNDLNLVPLNEGLPLNNNNNNIGVHDFLGRSINGDPRECNQMQQQQQQRHVGPGLNLNSSPAGVEFLGDNFDPLVVSRNNNTNHDDHHMMMIMIQPNHNPILSVGRVPPPPPCDHHDQDGHHHQLIMNDYDESSPFQALASATRLTTTFGRRRLQDNAAERSHNRRIRNRDSAARSRARRESYTNELELELSRLLAENAELKRQHEQLRLVVNVQGASWRVLQRASTAPF
ncbi:hypothetical protein Dsin_011403 [Dipteronia sinensis]|uniref:BZIP domain-containing protein n=1 Tax=Dipteronia sinensis TaxID=43782 RepID=A0AAE0EDH4_9ROSI|nr:hypothetical protein Dsin_011403 [Dipteronia sinensis]